MQTKLNGADPTLTAELTPTKVEIQTLKERGFHCQVPRNKWDTIRYDVGHLTCCVVPHVDIKTFDKDDAEVKVLLEPKRELADVVFVDASANPPHERVVNEIPLPRRSAIVIAIHELFASSGGLPIELPQTSQGLAVAS
jgi:hypothetical protein